MYDAGRIEQLNILQKWRTNDSTKSLQAPIGIDINGNQIVLDIHEKVHGPHGLIAGSTGSGKSELIITYILSLAVNYHPNDVEIILIDYKGGGLSGAFQKGDVKLPHIVGTITNIDKAGLQRSLVSIQSELRRRQVKFNQAREKTDEGTIDIYKYQKLYHDGQVSEPIPHLLIICDEFAELKQQQKNCLKNIAEGNPLGIQVEKNLVVYTDLQRENEKDLKAEKILEVLLKKHKIIILDTDFSTDVSYFLYSKKIYLVQTMDVLTIQSFTEFLSKLKSQNAINDEKIRVVLNKFINLNGITEKELINRLAFYNDPTKSYMQQLFEKNGLKYTTIPYNQLAYESYLQYMAEYKITKVEYIIGFKNQLDGLADDVIS